MRYLSVIIVSGVVLVAGSGCVHYHPRPLSPEKTAALLQARRLDDAGLKTFIETNTGRAVESWPLARWDMDSLTLAAFYFHPDIEVARAQWQLAEAGIKTAGARPNPSVTLTPQYNTTTTIPSPWGPSASVDIPIETAGKRGKRIAEAEKVAEGARWDFVSAAWAVRSNVRGALADYQFARRRLPLLQQQLAAQQEIVRLEQGQFEAGEISRPELTTAQMALNKTQLDATAAESKMTDARSRLAEALGVSVVALNDIEISEALPNAPTDQLTSDEARQAALLGRADIRSALADYAAAEDDLKLQIAKQYPDVHLDPGYQFDQGDNKWSIGLTFDLPILDQNQGPIKEAKARRELSAAKFLQLQAQVIGQVERAVAGWQSAQKQGSTAGELLAAATKQKESIAAQVKAGAAARLDQASADIDFDSAQLAQLDSAEQQQAALGALEDALQSPADSINAVIEKISMKTKKQAKASHP